MPAKRQSGKMRKHVGVCVMGWLCLGLAGIVTYRAINPRTRNEFRWGRTHTSIPMSALGRVIVILTLLGISAAAFGWLPLIAIFVAVPVLACAGVYDSYWHRRRVRQQRGNTTKMPDRKSDVAGE